MRTKEAADLSYAKTNYRKAEQLGMPFGTANGRLKLQILFKYVVLAGHDNCFKCGLRIVSPFELSVEHKKPWLDENIELFWDLENIAFSHRKCNTANRPGLTLRKNNSKGKQTCPSCEETKPLEMFDIHRRKWNGRYVYCKSCKSIRNKKRLKP